MLHPDPSVLIIGAGPTGLAAAAVLSKLGISVRVIDKNAARSTQSKALGVQAGTLTCLAEVFGPELSEQMVAAGQPAQEAFVHVHAVKPIRVDLSRIDGAYRYILILPQSETERFLEIEAEKYGAKVERNTELLTYQETDGGIEAILKLPSGTSETVRSKFILGCDGAHSIVRKFSDISFAGGPYTGDFILGDVKINWPWAFDSIRTFIRPQGIIAAFPLKGYLSYRLILIPKSKTGTPFNPDISLSEFQSVVKKISEGEIEVLSSTWLTRFRVHHRMAHTFQKSRVFLAGDAAHIHSPAGGQGMNTGIQDALNLSFKLKKVLDGAADLNSLKQYSEERVPVAKGVLRGTDIVFRLALLPESKWVGFLRKFILPRIIEFPPIQRGVVHSISEMKVARQEVKRYRS